MKEKPDSEKKLCSSLLAALVGLPQENRVVLSSWKNLNVKQLKTQHCGGAKMIFLSQAGPLCCSPAAQQKSVVEGCCAEVLSCPPPREPLHAAWPTFSLSLSLCLPRVSAAVRQMPNRWVCERVGNACKKNLTSWLNVIFAVEKPSLSKLKSNSWLYKPSVPQW